MIVQLNITNNLPVSIVVNSASATGQPLVPGQILQATFSLQEDENGVAELHLSIDQR
jgi:hypothetical protein